MLEKDTIEKQNSFIGILSSRKAKYIIGDRKSVV